METSLSRALKIAASLVPRGFLFGSARVSGFSVSYLTYCPAGSALHSSRFLPLGAPLLSGRNVSVSVPAAAPNGQGDEDCFALVCSAKTSIIYKFENDFSLFIPFLKTTT